MFREYLYGFGAQEEILKQNSKTNKMKNGLIIAC